MFCFVLYLVHGMGIGTWQVHSNLTVTFEQNQWLHYGFKVKLHARWVIDRTTSSPCDGPKIPSSYKLQTSPSVPRLGFSLWFCPCALIIIWSKHEIYWLSLCPGGPPLLSYISSRASLFPYISNCITSKELLLAKLMYINCSVVPQLLCNGMLLHFGHGYW